MKGMNKKQVLEAIRKGRKWGYGYKATDLNGNTRINHGAQRTQYAVGKWVRADRLDRNKDEDCGHGIHIGSATFIRWWTHGHEPRTFRFFLLKFRLNGNCIIPNGVCGKWRVLRAFVVKEIKRP